MIEENVKKAIAEQSNLLMHIQNGMENIKCQNRAQAHANFSKAMKSILNVLALVVKIEDENEHFLRKNSREKEVKQNSFLRNTVDLNLAKNGIKIETNSLISGNAFSLKIVGYPLIKDRFFSSKVRELLSNPLMTEIIRDSSPGVTKMSEAYVIFVYHDGDSKQSAPSYYDNDNVAIKALLDATVPLILPDDSIRFCDNLYFNLADTSTFIELLFIQKGHLIEAKELLQGIRFFDEVFSS